MINRKIHIITLFFFISLSILKGGDAPWTCSVSNNYHTIYIADISNLYVQTEPLDTGDYIGVFYEEKPGQLGCGGYYQLSNLKDTVKILAYGDDSVNSGFAPG